MFKKNGGYSRLDAPLRRSDYSQYSAESSRDGAGQTFHFSSPAVDGADEELLDQEYELRSRGSGVALSAQANSQSGERKEYITHDVVADDTLQTISIKYSVPIAELKRANNLFTDKELCARRFLRVPVRPNSLLTERPAEPPTELLVRLDEAADAGGRLSPASAASLGSAASVEVRPFGDGVHEGNKLLRNVDRELSAVRAKASELRAEGVLGAGGLAAATGPLWPPPPRPAGICSCSGADCGLQWLCLLAIALVVLVVVPIWYIVREYETDNLGHHHHAHGPTTTPGGVSL